SELLHDRSPIHITSVHLSAFNTPQFDWAKNLTARRAEPVPPVFQPELAARAIVWAASQRRREVYVGWPALKAVLANKLAPGLLDRVLASEGYSGQLTSEAKPADACENLYAPCDTNPGAHGRFDACAHEYSVQWWLTSHRTAVMSAAAGCALLLTLAALKHRRARVRYSFVPKDFDDSRFKTIHETDSRLRRHEARRAGARHPAHR